MRVAVLVCVGLVGFFSLTGCVEEEPPVALPIVNLTAEILTGPGARTPAQTATFTFRCSERECTFECRLGDNDFQRCTSPKQYTNLGEGAQVFTLRAQDRAGNRSPEVTWNWEIDLSMPEVVGLTGPEELTNRRSASFDFGCSQENCEFLCRLNNEEVQTCRPGVGFTGLSNGTQRFSVRARNELGRTSEPAVWTWTVDATAPRVVGLTGPERLTNQGSATFDFGCSKSNCTFECRLDNQDFSTCSPGVSFDSLSQGARRFQVRATDALGTRGPVSNWEWQIDQEAPDIEGLQGPDSPSNQTAATLSFQCSKENCLFECELNGEPLGQCQSPFQVAGLGDGEQIFGVRAIDGAGNEGSLQTFEWTVDLDVPEVTFLAGPEGLVNVDEATFEFQCSKPDCFLSCDLSRNGLVIQSIDECSSPLVFADLVDGSYLLAVSSTDEAGNQGAVVTREWTINSIAPEVVNLTGPPVFTNEAAPEFGFECSKTDCTFQCALYDEDTDALVEEDLDCASPFSVGVLLDGSYRFEVKAVDEAGNESDPESLGFEVDTIAPTILNFTGPSSITNQDAATFEFQCSEANCVFTCLLDGEPVEPCASGMTLASLADGTRLFQVFATDQAGNIGAPLSYEWTIDTVVPEIAFLSGPLENTSATTASFSFQCVNKDFCTFRCALDAFIGGDWVEGSFEVCSSPAEESGLLSGEYRFRVEGTDEAGNQGLGSFEWTIEEIAWVNVSAGSFHNCGTTNEGKLYCWGYNNSGQLGVGDRVSRFEPLEVGDETTWVQVSAGESSTCGIREGRLFCWGEGFAAGQVFDRALVPEEISTLQDWDAIAMGLFHGCAIRQGELYCWGNGGEGRLGLGSTDSTSDPTRVGTDSDWTDISAGSRHTCGIRSGQLYCWGHGTSGRLGTGNSTAQDVPTLVGSSSGWTAISAGNSHSCGLQGGELYCWGSGSLNRLGRGNPFDSSTPSRIGAESDWEDITAGGAHTCGIRNSELYCWGSNSQGQAGQNTELTIATPTQVGTDSQWTAVVANAEHSCAIGGGERYCWGRNQHGQIGVGAASQNQFSPRELADWNFEILEVGPTYGCGIDDQGRLYCWGNNSFGVLGLGDQFSRTRPTQVGTHTDWTHIAPSVNHTCGIRDGHLYCWGSATSGRLGIPSYFTIGSRSTPQRVGDDTDWTAIATGSSHTCGIRDHQFLYCWGAGSLGQNGVSPGDLGTPAPVDNTGVWESISLGFHHSCGIREGRLFCWGKGDDGRLGDDDTTNRFSPVQIGTETDWMKVSAGRGHTCGIRSGELYCWGNGSFGRLGIGNTTQRLVPTRVGDSSQWTDISAGFEYSCGIDDDNLYCFGQGGSSGQIGLGSIAGSTTPAQIGTSQWIRISAAHRFTGGIQADGTVWLWGAEESGRQGDGLAFFSEPQ